MDELKPEYNILKITGSSLYFIYTEEAKVKISKIYKGKIDKNSHNFGTIRSAETKALMSLRKLGKNYLMFGLTFSEEIKALMSFVLSG